MLHCSLIGQKETSPEMQMTFRITTATPQIQVMLAAILIAAQTGGSPSRLMNELVQDLRVNHYPESYILGALKHIGM